MIPGSPTEQAQTIAMISFELKITKTKQMKHLRSLPPTPHTMI
jgi:hypothetical protein